MKHHLKHAATHCGIQGITHGSFITLWASGKTSSVTGFYLLQWGIDNIHLLTEENTFIEIGIGIVGLFVGVGIAKWRDWLRK